MNLIFQHLGGSEGLEAQDHLVYILNLMSVWATQQDLVQKKKKNTKKKEWREEQQQQKKKE